MYTDEFETNSAKCDDVGERAGRKTEFGIMSGCFIQVNGHMIPVDSWRGEYELPTPPKTGGEL